MNLPHNVLSSLFHFKILLILRRKLVMSKTQQFFITVNFHNCPSGKAAQIEEPILSSPTLLTETLRATPTVLASLHHKSQLFLWGCK